MEITTHSAQIKVSDSDALLGRLAEITNELCADYPNIESVEPWEKLYALEQSYRGIDAANTDLHAVIEKLRIRCGMTKEEVAETMTTENKKTTDQRGDSSVESTGLLADCERRAIEIYYAAPPEKLAGECRAELVAEFGESVVAKMLSNGIGNNGLANAPDQRPGAKTND